MHDAPPNPDVAFDDSDDAVAARAARRRWAVDALIEVGVALGRRLGAEVEASDEAAAEAGDVTVAVRLGGRDPALAYSRIFRAVRLGVALGERLDDPDWEPAAKRGRDRAGAPGGDLTGDELTGGEQTGGEQTGDELTDEDRARLQAGISGHILGATIQDVVESLIETEVEADGDEARGDRLWDAMRERLEDGEEQEAIGGRSIGESIALICKDLGLDPDWNDWRYEDWAKEEAREETLGSPFGRPRRAEGVHEPDALEPADGEANIHGPP